MIPHHCLFTLWLDELSGKNGCTGLSDALDPCMHPRYMHVQTGRQTGMHAYTLTLRMYTHTHTHTYIYIYVHNHNNNNNHNNDNNIDNYYNGNDQNIVKNIKYQGL